MSSVKKKRNIFASRAHSFKENFLEAIKHGHASSNRKTRPDKSAIILAKKTSSTDNLTVTGHLGTSKTTDCLVKDVQLALKYFQDVVSKETYEMLPGCATVVLETVLAIKAFASNLSDDAMDQELSTALNNAFKSVSQLTSWADHLGIISDGEAEHEAHGAHCRVDECVENIIEPVRRAVIVAVNCIAVRLGNINLARGNSLPDITNDSDSLEYSLSSDSLENINNVKPQLFPKQVELRAPPLPPKHLKPKMDRFEDLLAHSLSLHNSIDWAPTPFSDYHKHQPGSSARRNHFHNTHQQHHLDKSISSTTGGLDTTYDQSFECSFDNTSQNSLSRESLTNVSFDEPDYSAGKMNMLTTTSWRNRSNNSSPSFETISFSSRDNNDHHYYHHDHNDLPPAIPKKSRVTSSSLGVSSSHTPATRPTPSSHQARKLSQYDNVVDTESHHLRQKMFEMRMSSEGQRHGTRSSPKQVLRTPERSLSSPKTTFRKTDEEFRDIPPPLPPKKRNIMSYMEMFGKSLFPSGDDLLEGFMQSHDILHNVWQQNFHEYSDYSPASANLINFPFPGSNHHHHHPYMNLKTSDLPAPALPPKRSSLSRSRPGSFRSSSDSAERRIPIMVEDTGSRCSQFSDSSSSSSSDTPRLAEITKISRLSSVNIPIQRLDHNIKQQDFSTPEPSLLDKIDVSEYLIYGEQSTTNNNNNNTSVNKESGAVELRAADTDALIVLATQTIKNDFLFQEAFLSTYRTFVNTETLVKKLVYRFKQFSTHQEPSHGSSLRISRNAFSLLVRVVHGKYSRLIN